MGGFGPTAATLADVINHTKAEVGSTFTKIVIVNNSKLQLSEGWPSPSFPLQLALRQAMTLDQKAAVRRRKVSWGHHGCTSARRGGMWYPYTLPTQTRAPHSSGCGSATRGWHTLHCQRREDPTAIDV